MTFRGGRGILCSAQIHQLGRAICNFSRHSTQFAVPLFVVLNGPDSNYFPVRVMVHGMHPTWLRTIEDIVLTRVPSQRCHVAGHRRLFSLGASGLCLTRTYLKNWDIDFKPINRLRSISVFLGK